MKRWYWLPRPRPSYRVIETTDPFDSFKVQQRYRWLNLEWWRTVDSSSVEDFAVEEMQRLERLIGKSVRERVVAE